MDLAVMFEPIVEPGFPAGYFYAHVPSLGLTTHGEGIEGARAAALELVKLWSVEKRAAGEPVHVAEPALFSILHISDDAVQGT